MITSANGKEANFRAVLKNIYYMIKRAISKTLRSFGYELKKISQNRNIPYNLEMQKGLQRFHALGIPINTICDVGAAEGGWSLLARSFWPEASFLLFEPLVERETILRNLEERYSKFHVICSAAGNGPGTISFAVSSDLDGSGVSFDEKADGIRTVTLASVQDEANRLKLPGGYVVKLDTHGFELPIIEGCERIISEIYLFVIECYGFHIAPKSLLFWEMCQYMEDKGFRLFDIVDVMRRKKDNAFWQCDAFFIRADHQIFSDNTFK